MHTLSINNHTIERISKANINISLGLRLLSKFMQAYEVDMDTAFMHLESNNYDFVKASYNYKQDLKARGE